jgi:hypothetical protein
VPFRASPMLMTGVALSKTSHSALLGLPPNGLRYPRWGERRNAVRLEKMLRRRKKLGIAPESPPRVHALLGGFILNSITCFYESLY